MSSMTRARALNAGALSLVMPGGGQWLQGRVAVGAWHLVEVLSLMGMAAWDARQRTVWVAVAVGVNLWSAVDAYWHEVRRPAPTAASA